MECIFCLIAKKKIHSKDVYRDDKAVAFLDINPRNPGHTVVIPTKHFESILDIPEDEAGELFKVVKRVAIGVKKGVKADGLSISQSSGQAAGQVIPHMHFHIIPRFTTEDPVSLEGILPVKKIDEKTRNGIVKNIKKHIPK